MILVTALIFIAIQSISTPASSQQKHHDPNYEAIRKENLANLDEFLAASRRNYRGECDSVMEGIQHFTDYISDDPRLIDTLLFIVKNSTEPSCIAGAIAFLPIGGRLGENLRARPKQWKEIAATLKHAMEDSSIKNWQTRYSAAAQLERMGPPYQDATYQFYIQKLAELADDREINDEKREEAVELITACCLSELRQLIPKGFYKQSNHKPPVETLRRVVKNLDLLTFWQSTIEKINPRYQAKEKEKLSKVRHLLEKG